MREGGGAKSYDGDKALVQYSEKHTFSSENLVLSSEKKVYFIKL